VFALTVKRRPNRTQHTEVCKLDTDSSCRMKCLKQTGRKQLEYRTRIKQCMSLGVKQGKHGVSKTRPWVRLSRYSTAPFSTLHSDIVCVTRRSLSHCIYTQKRTQVSSYTHTSNFSWSQCTGWFRKNAQTLQFLFTGQNSKSLLYWWGNYCRFLRCLAKRKTLLYSRCTEVAEIFLYL
jgi:hypothetical protein